MKRIKWIIILVNCVVLLVFFNRSVFDKERILSDGKLVLLELAPVDPRSLMQGDYMRLQYAIGSEVRTDSISKRGYCVVKLNDGIASRMRLQAGRLPLREDELLIGYNASDRTINIGAESYFFQEGEADKFANAKYGGLKVDTNGQTILVGLYDEHKNLIR